ncbi:hypothetical protein N790_01360 [Arenimonas malthae CC-JY-1]|uniref:CD-NTase-associated protein 15 domain-containing protein n=1 Tax=Arenimonas malthae CC-JY-1 TaxID=1384054 RepID=A0A091BCH0_9GAMM|nr:hypothetical protein [Arenimonas malthae]KFN48494.1 hypothetical protein N790_01360 [Arenimonas malthae CC-JY-1]
MISLISPLKIIKFIAVAYAGFCAIIWLLIEWLWPGIETELLLRVVFSLALLLDAALWVTAYFLWRKLWARYPILSTALFPDLNGDWRMAIQWSGVDDKGIPAQGTVQATASIKQTLLHLSMEVESHDSDSETLIAKPRKDPESGRPMIYYLYRVIPRKTTAKVASPYEGAAILRFDAGPGPRLRGNYFTSRMRHGHFTLERI